MITKQGKGRRPLLCISGSEFPLWRGRPGYQVHMRTTAIDLSTLYTGYAPHGGAGQQSTGNSDIDAVERVLDLNEKVGFITRTCVSIARIRERAIASGSLSI